MDGGEPESNLPSTTTTSADTTLVKTRVDGEDALSLYESSTISTPSGTAIWTNRIFTDPEKIYADIKEKKS